MQDRNYSSRKIQMKAANVEILEIIAIKKGYTKQRMFGKLLELCLLNWKPWKLDKFLKK